MSYDVIIIGAGPGGLACAAAAATMGLKTLVLERKRVIGPKVCAGGVTWNGLIKKVPVEIMERECATQHIFTRAQERSVSSATPIIATVSREKLGQEMAEKARLAGAEIRSNCQVRSVSRHHVTIVDKTTGKDRKEQFAYLVGADGSSSLVRRYLGIPVHDVGIGINYQLPGCYPQMQWHLNTSLFASGYAWVFPHRQTVSIGAYVDSRVMKAKNLKKICLSGEKSKAMNLPHTRERRSISILITADIVLKIFFLLVMLQVLPPVLPAKGYTRR